MQGLGKGVLRRVGRRQDGGILGQDDGGQWDELWAGGRGVGDMPMIQYMWNVQSHTTQFCAIE